MLSGICRFCGEAWNSAWRKKHILINLLGKLQWHFTSSSILRKFSNPLSGNLLNTSNSLGTGWQPDVVLSRVYSNIWTLLVKMSGGQEVAARAFDKDIKTSGFVLFLVFFLSSKNRNVELHVLDCQGIQPVRFLVCIPCEPCFSQ